MGSLPDRKLLFLCTKWSHYRGGMLQFAGHECVGSVGLKGRSEAFTWPRSDFIGLPLCVTHISLFVPAVLCGRGCPPLICLWRSPLVLCEASLLKAVCTLFYLPSIKGFLQTANIERPHSLHCFVPCVCVYGMFDPKQVRYEADYLGQLTYMFSFRFLFLFRFFFFFSWRIGVGWSKLDWSIPTALLWHWFH